MGSLNVDQSRQEFGLFCSLPNCCPNWREMCFIKDLFWDEEDVVIQYHPKKSEYVNLHNNYLHLWRPIGVEIPTPKELVG